MKSTCIFIFLIMTSLSFSQIKSPALQIEESIRALPYSMRENATVIGFNQQGERVVLKNGTNDMTCWADSPGPDSPKGAFYVVCFPKSLESYMNRLQELKKISPDQAHDLLALEIKSGKIVMPDIAIRYTLRGHSAEGALPLTVIHVPFTTAEATGFSDKIDHFRPWLMWGGTAHAHIMVPGH